jgi:4-hydroxybenzoate polyprenyltransferase
MFIIHRRAVAMTNRRSISPIGAFWRMLHPLPSLMTVVVAGAFVVLAARGLPPIGRFAQLLAIETAMQFSISAFNDYFDRHVDAGRADKPVASGAISARTAWVTGLLLGVAAILLALPLGAWVAALTAIGLGGGLLYDAGLKYTAFSWLPFCIAFPTLPLWAWAGASPDGAFPPQLFWVVPVGGVLVLGIHLADTIPDLAADTEAGVRGLAHRLGPARSLALCWGAFGVGTLLTLALLPFLRYSLEWYLPGLVVGTLLLCAGVLVYLYDAGKVRLMSLLLEIGAMSIAVGWVAGITL